MLSPKKVKYRKVMKGNTRGTSWRGSDVSFGDFGLQCLGPGKITSRQIEAARMAITLLGAKEAPAGPMPVVLAPG